MNLPKSAMARRVKGIPISPYKMQNNLPLNVLGATLPYPESLFNYLILNSKVTNSGDYSKRKQNGLGKGPRLYVFLRVLSGKLQFIQRMEKHHILKSFGLDSYMITAVDDTQNYFVHGLVRAVRVDELLQSPNNTFSAPHYLSNFSLCFRIRAKKLNYSLTLSKRRYVKLSKLSKSERLNR